MTRKKKLPEARWVLSREQLMVEELSFQRDKKLPASQRTWILSLKA